MVDVLSSKPLLEFNLDTVRRLAGLGLSNSDIAISLGCSRSTYQRRLRDDPDFLHAVDLGHSDLIIELSNLVLTRARGGDVQAAMWLLERKGGPGWCKTNKVEAEIHDNRPVLNIVLTGIQSDQDKGVKIISLDDAD